MDRCRELANFLGNWRHELVPIPRINSRYCRSVCRRLYPHGGFATAWLRCRQIFDQHTLQRTGTLDLGSICDRDDNWPWHVHHPRSLTCSKPGIPMEDGLTSPCRNKYGLFPLSCLQEHNALGHGGPNSRPTKNCWRPISFSLVGSHAGRKMGWAYHLVLE